MSTTTPQFPAIAAGPITPTDISQFIRLEQCERYLRLRLHERTFGGRFLREYGVVPQTIPPLLTRSGSEFERTIEREVAGSFATRHIPARTPGQGGDDNELVAGAAADLPAGETLVIFQPRLAVALGDWRFRGDLDILRLERDGDGRLRVLIADMKSSTSPKIEHRLQVAFYHEMVATLLATHQVEYEQISTGILYRGPAGETKRLSPEEAALRASQRAAAQQAFGAQAGFLEIVERPEPYLDAVSDLVIGADSAARRIGRAEFEQLPSHLTYKCDGCLYNEFCMKWGAEHDDLSLLPHLTATDKSALRRTGVMTVRQLAELKSPEVTGNGNGQALVPVPGAETLLGTLAATWPVGPRLDELIHRARRYRRWKGDPIEALSYIPSKGYGSLPYSSPEQNSNLVRIFIDAQHDYLHDRIYMLGALLVGCEQGEPRPERRRAVVRMTPEAPATGELEEALFVDWIGELLRDILEVAAPDEQGERWAPIHLIFYDHFDQQLLLDGLARHAGAVLGATPLYDFVTQLAAFDSPLVTYLNQEIQELKNYPMVCQSLQSVAAYLKFDWNTPEPFRQIFRTRLFDFWGKLDGAEEAGETAWYTSRARFNSQIPLEYAYAAWGDLALPGAGRDLFEPYRGASVEALTGFHQRRLEALEHISGDFKGNSQTVKTAFDLSIIAAFDDRARTLANALDEFVLIERHVALSEWKTARLAPPERRVLAGDTLLGTFHEAEQEITTRVRNAENRRKVERLAALKVAGTEISKDEKKSLKSSQQGLRMRLRFDVPIDCTLEEMLGLTTLHEGSGVVLRKRWEVDSRLPAAQQVPFTPTPKQLLYGSRGTIVSVQVTRDLEGRAVDGFVEVEMRDGFGGKGMRGFAFGSRDEPFEDDAQYTLDEDPNDWYGYHCAKVTETLCAGGANALYNRLLSAAATAVEWPAAAVAGQERFYAGLSALHTVGAMNAFEPAKEAFIGSHGEEAILLVQGPPGTGKSYTTAFALLARLQGALAADHDFRVFVSCKTHAATDVLLGKIVEAQEKLVALQEQQPAIFAQYIDARLIEVPLFRMAARNEPHPRVRPLFKKDDRPKGVLAPVRQIEQERWCVVATTPGGTYTMVKEQWKELLGHELCDCLVLDEASQMNLPEAIMAALLLKPAGQLIVVGDHRQMPPIVMHDWATERRRTFQEYRTYESLFSSLLPLATTVLRFAESFRLHRDMAEFLRREVYHQDGIEYFSRKDLRLVATQHADPFVAAVLDPAYTLVAVVHGENESQMRNPFEQALITPILEALAEEHHLEPRHGLGVVVPHRAQRAALQEAVPAVTVRDPVTQAIMVSAVDTVERFQGDERDVILVSATESDREYLQLNGEFLLDPRRLTVAMSRARHKMVLVASQSVFSLFSADEATFLHAQLWKNLLRYTCTVLLWEGEREGIRVQVWGNRAPE